MDILYISKSEIYCILYHPTRGIAIISLISESVDALIINYSIVKKYNKKK